MTRTEIARQLTRWTRGLGSRLHGGLWSTDQQIDRSIRHELAAIADRRAGEPPQPAAARPVTARPSVDRAA